MLSVFHNRRWDGDFVTLREIVCEKKLIGDVFHVEMFGGGYGKPGPWWRSKKEISGGHFFDWGAHYLDWLLQIMPQRITGVTGFFHKLKWHEVTNEDNVEAAIRFENGAVAHVHMSSLAMVGKERWRLLGTEGAVLSADGKFIVSTDVAGYRARLEVPYKNSDWDAYYANIADHLTTGADLVVKAEQARRVIAVMDTAERSSASGQTEPFPAD
jgi:predicted dehydrogenase